MTRSSNPEEIELSREENGIGGFLFLLPALAAKGGMLAAITAIAPMAVTSQAKRNVRDHLLKTNDPQGQDPQDQRWDADTQSHRRTI